MLKEAPLAENKLSSSAGVLRNYLSFRVDGRPDEDSEHYRSSRFPSRQGVLLCCIRLMGNLIGRGR